MDFLLLNAAARARLTHAGVDAEHRGRERPSDHAPAWITLRDARARGAGGAAGRAAGR
jgi:exodeoxyribonuclease-3